MILFLKIYNLWSDQRRGGGGGSIFFNAGGCVFLRTNDYS